MVFILLTGASSGIGAAAAVELTRQGHQVLVTGQSAARVRAVHERMSAIAPAGVEVPSAEVADLADLAAVRRLADLILRRHDRLDVLVNNAGVQPRTRRQSADGFELTLAVNHIAHFELTKRLAPRIRDSGGRVVTTSSSNHAGARLDLADLQLVTNWDAGRAYDQSKLANLLFTRQLRDRLDLPGSAFHPGTVTTDLNRESRFFRWAKPFERVVMASPARGADTLVWLALSKEGGDPSAPYYVKRRPHSISFSARDDRLAADLWDATEELVAGTRIDDRR